MTDNKLAIKLSGVTKTYHLRLEKPTLIESLVNTKRRKVYTALDNIDLIVNKGEKIGVIGSNGSGKTTLLKIISGISTPNKGFVKTWGKVVSLIDLSAGFHPELSGIDNIYQNAMLLGMSRREIGQRVGEIVDFADIGEFINAPMYTYSSGMKLRLGFSVAVAVDPDILILDEGVAVGDENFQKKSGARIELFFKQGKTILMVSHWMDYLRQHCRRVIWLERGSVIKDGGLEVIGEYEKNKLVLKHV